MSDDDLHWLYPDRSDEDVACDWLGRGRALVVITRDGAGVYAISARGELRRPAMAVDLVDTVGAGDSFTPACSTAYAAPTCLVPRGPTRSPRSMRRR